MIMPYRRVPIRVIVLGVVLLMAAAFGGGIFYGRTFLPPTVGVYNAAPPSSTSNKANFGVFWEAWQLIHNDYADKSAVNDQNLTYGAIRGMVDALGDTGHTRFLTPDEVKKFSNSLSGTFVGVGVRVQQRDKQLIITTPLPNSPAQKAGIKAGDIIVSVDGKDVTATDEDTILKMILGQEGTQVTLGIQRAGEAKPLSFTLTRATIETISVYYTYIPEAKTGLIRISQFDKNVADRVDAALKDLKAQGMQRLILDLRDNSGGLLDQCVKTADEFMNGGTIFIEQNSDGTRKPYTAQPGGELLDQPIVVLTNGNTASAAEILTAALEQNGRARAVVGTKTFGTGTVLTTRSLSDGSAVLLGTQEWLTPKGEFIRGNGVPPTVVLEQPADALPVTISSDHAAIPQATIQSSSDSQLKKALDILSTK